jgi:hypothetical protein
MPRRRALVPPGPAAGRPGTTGLHLSRIVHRVFPERPLPVFRLRPDLSRVLIASFGRGAETDAHLARTGNGFVPMSEALLEDLGGPAPEADAVWLAYHAPDLYHADVAGCWLAQRLPGSPVPCSVARPGPAAAFTVLRIASGMCRLGELDRGVLIACDQNAVVWEEDDPAHLMPDAAALLELGPAGDVRVDEVEEAPGPGPAAAVVAALLDRHPGTRLLAGACLAAALAGTPQAARVEAAPQLWGTSVWAGLARRWPLAEPLLVADRDPVGGAVHSCLLTPRGPA